MRFFAEPKVTAKGARISLINYFGNDGPLGFMEMLNDEDEEVRLRHWENAQG